MIQIIELDAKICTYDISNPLDAETKMRLIEYMARKSHASEDKMTADSYTRFLTSVVRNKGDWSVTRHATVACEFTVPLGIAAELRTHKSGQYNGDDVDSDVKHLQHCEEVDEWHHGFTQSSTRFVKFTHERPLEVILPYGIDTLHHDADSKKTRAYYAWLRMVNAAEIEYNELIDLGHPPQVARDILPRCTAARLGVTYTINQWRYFFLMRTTIQAHPQVRIVSRKLLQQFQYYFPIFFSDIEPEQSQSQNLRLPW